MKYLCFLLLIISCQQKDYAKELNSIEENLKHDVDSIDRHYGRIQRLVDAGYSIEEADSILNVE